MSWSIKLFSVRGIAVRVHATFLLVLLWAAYLGVSGGAGRPGGWPHGVVFMVLFVLFLFVCVVLHELGHSLVAQLFGVKVQDITLWPIGGVARMARMPEKSYQEFIISAAGPATNVLLALLRTVLALALARSGQLLSVVQSPWLLGRGMATMDAWTLLVLLIVNNVILALFNLLPAFPLDGGRLFRSLLAAFLPFGRATRIASWTGQGVAGLMVALGLITGNPGLALIGLLVFLAAGQERQQVVVEDHLRGLRVDQAMRPLGQRLHPLQTMGEVAILAYATPQVAYAVVDGGRLVGCMARADLLTALRKAGPGARVTQHMQRELLKVAPGDSLVDVQGCLAQEHRDAAFVIENGSVAGMLTSVDLARLVEVLAAWPQAFHGRTLS